MFILKESEYVATLIHNAAKKLETSLIMEDSVQRILRAWIESSTTRGMTYESR